jgi:hypothetical protein
VRTGTGNGFRQWRETERNMSSESARKTYGFGRVSPRLAPSPYSPLHMPSQIPGSRPAVPVPRARRSGVGRVVAVGLVIALVGVVTGTFKLTGSAPAPVAAPPHAPAKPPALSDEAERLSRSAIAVSRYPRPRT